MTRRSFLGTLLIALLPVGARAQAPWPKVTVYKSAACGCCGLWEQHMRAAGFLLDSRAVSDLGAVKRRHRVPDALASCHTALAGGYVIEGHVPAADVQRLLRERPKAIGLAVPGMPVGAPGMEQGAPRNFVTVAFDDRRDWVFQTH